MKNSAGKQMRRCIIPNLCFYLCELCKLLPEMYNNHLWETLNFSRIENSVAAIMRSSDTILTKKIKEVIHAFVYDPPRLFATAFSIYLCEKLNYDYTYMANVFSRTEGETIEKHLILKKISRVKELIVINELSFAEIARKQLYCSLPHLCSQFKRVTGERLSDFKKK